MLPGPVFEVELVTTSRRLRYYLLRFVYGLLLLFFIWQTMTSWRGSYRDVAGEFSIQQMALVGQSLFATFAFTQAAVLLFVTPAIVAGAIADERQRKTLHYLLSSRLSSGEIVLGKLAARLLLVGVLFLVGLPVVVMLTFFGGVDPNDVMLYFAASASTVFLIAAASIAVSTYARRPREAVIFVYLLELLWLFGPSLADWVVPGFSSGSAVFYERIKPVNANLVGACSPFYLAVNLLGPSSGGRNYVNDVLRMIGLQGLYAVLLVVLAVAWLRPLFRKEGQSVGVFGKVVGRHARRWLPRPACGDDAMLWKERYVARTNSLTKVGGGLILSLAAALLIYGTFHFASPAFSDLTNHGLIGSQSSRTRLNGWLKLAVTLLGTALLVGTACAASSGLSGEREEDTWISLIASPLTPLEIVRAKIFGAFWGLRGMILLWAAFVLTGVLLRAVHPLGVLSVLVATATYVGFGAVLGTFFSLVARTSARALVATIVTLILINGFYLIAFIPVPIESSLRYLGVTPFVEGAALLGQDDVDAMFVTTYEPDRPRTVDLALTCIASVLVYGVATAVLAAVTITSFDDLIDRPRTEGIGATPLREPLPPRLSDEGVDVDVALPVHSSKSAEPGSTPGSDGTAENPE